MIGAGACYCVYKLTIGRDDSDKSEEEEEEWDDDQELDEEEPDLWFDSQLWLGPGVRMGIGLNLGPLVEPRTGPQVGARPTEHTQ